MLIAACFLNSYFNTYLCIFGFWVAQETQGCSSQSRLADYDYACCFTTAARCVGLMTGLCYTPVLYCGTRDYVGHPRAVGAPRATPRVRSAACDAPSTRDKAHGICCCLLPSRLHIIVYIWFGLATHESQGLCWALCPGGRAKVSNLAIQDKCLNLCTVSLTLNVTFSLLLTSIFFTSMETLWFTKLFMVAF